MLAFPPLVWFTWLHARDQPDLSYGQHNSIAKLERANTLKVFALNSFYLPSPVHLGSRASERADVLIQELQDRSVDLVALSETFDPAVSSKIARALSDSHPHQLVSVPPRTFWKINGGVSLYSKYPLLDWGWVPFAACSKIDCVANKGFVWARVGVPVRARGRWRPGERARALMRERARVRVRDIWVVTMHMDSGRGEGNLQARTAQLAQLKGILSRIPAKSPVLVVGDLNINGSRLSGEYVRLLQSVYPLRDVALDAGLPTANTLNCDTTIWCSESPNHVLELQERLDYIFWRGPPLLELLSATHLPYADPCPGVPYLSDHHAIEAVFKIR